MMLSNFHWNMYFERRGPNDPVISGMQRENNSKEMQEEGMALNILHSGSYKPTVSS